MSDSAPARVRLLHEAFYRHDLKTVRRILKEEPPSTEVDNFKRYLLNVLVSEPDTSMSFQHFLALSKSPIFDIEAETAPEDATGLHLACSNICMKYVRRLLKEDADPHETLLETYSALYYAVRTKNLRIVKSFLNCAENIDYAGSKGRTALHLSAKFGHLDVSRILLKRGANPRIINHDFNTPLHCAIKTGHVDIAHLLVKKCDLITRNLPDRSGMTPLMMAAKNNDSEGVRMLLENGAKVEICDIHGQMALHFVALIGNAELLALMLQLSDTSSVEKETLNVQSSLKWYHNLISLTCCAIRSGNIKCLEVLVTSKFSKGFLQTPHIECHRFI